MSDQVSAILERPYARVLEREPDGRYSSRVLEFPGCFSEGDTPDEAIRRLDEALEGVVEVMLEDGQPIPVPLSETEYAGRISLRLPPSLHRKVAELAATSGISLNRWLSDAIAEAAAVRPGGAAAPERPSKPAALVRAPRSRRAASGE